MAKICLDAGHYAKYNPSPVVSGYYESDMNWKLTNKLAKELESYGIKVVKTRTNKAKDLELHLRGQASQGCDLFLSIHSNASTKESTDNPMAYCLISDDSTNIDEKSCDIGLKLAKTVAEIMQTKGEGKVARRKGNNGDYYGVLRGAKSVGTPAVLLEHSYHTNTRATKWLMVDSNLDKLAVAEAKVIAEWLGVGTKSVVDKPDEMYRVQVGAFSKKANAQAMVDKLKKAGFDAVIVGEEATVESISKSIEEIALEVIKGLWGNGTERKRRLTEAGYDYAAVQKKVNELL